MFGTLAVAVGAGIAPLTMYMPFWLKPLAVDPATGWFVATFVTVPGLRVCDPLATCWICGMATPVMGELGVGNGAPTGLPIDGDCGKPGADALIPAGNPLAASWDGAVGDPGPIATGV